MTPQEQQIAEAFVDAAEKAIGQPLRPAPPPPKTTYVVEGAPECKGRYVHIHGGPNRHERRRTAKLLIKAKKVVEAAGIDIRSFKAEEFYEPTLLPGEKVETLHVNGKPAGFVYTREEP